MWEGAGEVFLLFTTRPNNHDTGPLNPDSSYRPPAPRLQQNCVGNQHKRRWACGLAEILRALGDTAFPVSGMPVPVGSRPDGPHPSPRCPPLVVDAAKEKGVWVTSGRANEDMGARLVALCALLGFAFAFSPSVIMLITATKASKAASRTTPGAKWPWGPSLPCLGGMRRFFLL